MTTAPSTASKLDKLNETNKKMAIQLIEAIAQAQTNTEKEKEEKNEN